MKEESFINHISNINSLVRSKFNNVSKYKQPHYNYENHVNDIIQSDYYGALIYFRHIIKQICDYYWSYEVKAFNVDLFMITPSVSSPMGLGSDSEVIPIKLGNLDTFLVDSSQFGFEPLLLNKNLSRLYCYLPSMRGEDSDYRHLNQFYHCEFEMIGEFDKLVPLVDSFIIFLSKMLLSTLDILNILSTDFNKTKEALIEVSNLKSFTKIEFEEAILLLEKEGEQNLVSYYKSGRDISHKAEILLSKKLSKYAPIWITSYDRDRVPFYQKPNQNKVINGDMIFPSLINNSFGGEILGAGQRQDNINEILESLNRQAINPEPYKWYIDLRKNLNYKSTSGFGLGIERYLAWILCKSDIRDVIPYPRIKNLRTFP